MTTEYKVPYHSLIKLRCLIAELSARRLASGIGHLFLQVLTPFSADHSTQVRIAASGDDELLQQAHGLCQSAVHGEPLQAQVTANPDSQYVGEVGSRINLTADIYSVLEFHNEYGRTFTTRLRDADGNEFVWFARKRMPLGPQSLSVRITKHEEYNGVRQTRIAYVKEL